MPVTEWRTQLRGAVYRGDGPAVVALAKAAPGDNTGGTDALQLIGDALRCAVVGRVVGAVELAADCVAGLRERGWCGDAELAAQLRALLGTGPTPMLRPLPVDLEELTAVLEGDPIYGGGRVDLHTGEVWPEPAIDYAPEIGEEPEEPDDDLNRWLPVECEGSRAGYHDMQAFIELLTDLELADRLRVALHGRGAFRRFKDVLGRAPEELRRWFAFSEERQRGRARAWLAEAGYSPSPRAPREVVT